MSYYGSSWNNRPPTSEQVDISSGQYPPPASDDRWSGAPDRGAVAPPAFGQHQPGPPWQQQQQMQQQPPYYPGPNNATAKNFNDFLDRKGLPSITPEDMAILQECGRESLYFRCLPLTAALCAGLVFTARARPTYRPSWIHYMGAVFLGYVGGKMSYRTTCENKLINSRSNSPFVNAIRKKRGLYVEEFAQDSLRTADSPAFESDWTTPAKSYGIDEFDREDREPTFSQSHGSYRRGPFSNRDDFDDISQDGQPPARPGTSYDDLRQRNRSSFKA